MSTMMTLNEVIYKQAARYRRWHNRNKVWGEKEAALRGRLLKSLKLVPGVRFSQAYRDVLVTVNWRKKIVNEEAVKAVLVEHGASAGIVTIETIDWDVVKELRQEDPALNRALIALEEDLDMTNYSPVLVVK